MLSHNYVFLKYLKKVFPEGNAGALPHLKWSFLCFVTLGTGWKLLIVVAKSSV